MALKQNEWPYKGINAPKKIGPNLKMKPDSFPRKALSEPSPILHTLSCAALGKQDRNMGPEKAT